MKMLVIEANAGGWNYCPADAPASFIRCCRYADDAPFATVEAAILAAERDKSIPRSVRPLTWQRLEHNCTNCGQLCDKDDPIHREGTCK